MKVTPDGAPAEPLPVGQLGRVHFTGIGGAGMSGIARILLARGITVSGSDARRSTMTGQLADLGADVHTGHDAGNLGGLGPGDTLVVSTAISADNPELAEARRRGLRILHRGSALASVMIGRRAAAVAGTHGKTTTAAMLATILDQCGAGPGYLIGGTLMSTGLGADDGAGEVFVAEADESDRSFLLLAPDVAVVTNIEADHLDNYGSLADVEASFAAFARRIRPGGLLITCADDPGARRLAETAVRDGLAARLLSYGTLPDRAGGTASGPAHGPAHGAAHGADGGAAHGADGGAAGGADSGADGSAAGGAPDYAVTGVTGDGMRTRFELRQRRGGAEPLRVELAVPGRHNALNAAAALAVAVELGFPAAQAAAGLAAFRGTGRRMEIKGDADGVRVLDSYAHHPTELAADLRTAREIVQGSGQGRGDGRVIAIFQPHLYSRTRFFAAEFGAALGLADEALVLDVYAAREEPDPAVTGQLVADRVPGGRASYLPDAAAVPHAVAAIAKPGDLVLTMGAGDVTALGPPIVAALAARAGT